MTSKTVVIYLFTVCDKATNLLMVSNEKGKFGVISGRMDEKDTPEKAAARVFEETIGVPLPKIEKVHVDEGERVVLYYAFTKECVKPEFGKKRKEERYAGITHFDTANFSKMNKEGVNFREVFLKTVTDNKQLISKFLK